MSTLDELWSRLKGVRILRYEASSEAGTGWTGVGEGSVAVSEPGPGELVFEERGMWQPERGGPIQFTNTYRWSRADDAIRLEHLRFGADRPVFLFDMIRGDDGEWRDKTPHICSEDCYGATLSIRGRELLLAWSIRGPQKRESIRYTYQ